MLTKAFVVAIAALTLWQGAAGQAAPFQDVLGFALNKTQGLAAQTSAGSAAQQLQTIVHNLVLSGESVLNSSRTAIEGLASTVEQAVSKALGDLPRCVVGQQAQAARLFVDAETGVWRCVTGRVTEIGALIGDVAELAAKAVLLPHEAAANITACLRDPLTSVFCTAEAVGAWGFASQQIVSAVTADVLKGEQLFATGPQNIAACAAAQVNAAADGVRQIVVSIAQCVVDGSQSTTTAST